MTQSNTQPCLYLLLVVISCYVYSIDAHGRLIEPPSRASAWRYGFQTPPDYNDHELYCGGFDRQWKKNEGKCGECGDAWDLPAPRPHEHGGQWGQGVVVRSYLPGTHMTIRVELTASHMGYFEFRLCPKPSAKQSCLDENLLQIIGGSPSQHSPTDLDTRFYPRNGSRIYDIKAQLPDLLCNQCVLQWRYIAGNNWGMCDDGVGAVGCGPQEEFRACSDIALTKDARLPHRPIRPTIRITTTSTTTTPTPESPKKEQPVDVIRDDVDSNGSLIFLIILMVLLVLSGLGIWLVYRYYPVRVDEWKKSLLTRFCKKQANSSNVNLPHNTVINPILSIDDIEGAKDGKSASPLSNTPHVHISPPIPLITPIPPIPPIPPPRTKRDSRVKENSTVS